MSTNISIPARVYQNGDADKYIKLKTELNILEGEYAKESKNISFNATKLHQALEKDVYTHAQKKARYGDILTFSRELHYLHQGMEHMEEDRRQVNSKIGYLEGKTLNNKVEAL